ncbi:hypothetical protein ABTU21_003809 [Escherichia coli]|uniref:hypothetical protein n=1 Tax=Escherichia coli TaxID=562 RepID=UPI001E6485AA|nr:hypothetical protein [Escherichia coli]MCC5019166.1 hypothetical protein [Escherichia coli]
MSDFSELISFKKDREEMRTESVYYVQHRNKRSVLDQELVITVTNGAIVIHTQRLKSDPGGNLLS